MEERSRWEGKREKKKGEKGNERRGWYPSQCVAFEGDDASLCKSRDPDGSREGRIYKEERERERGVRKEDRRRKRGEIRGRKGGHEEEDDGSEASSTVLGYSLPVSWGPRCTRTILFLFLFLFFATHCFPLFFSISLGPSSLFFSFLSSSRSFPNFLSWRFCACDVYTSSSPCSSSFSSP